MATLLVDDREQWTVARTLEERGGFEVEQQRLETGDILNRDLDAIAERKTFQDALDVDRLFAQVDRMNEEFTHSALVVHGQRIDSIKADIKGGHANATRQVMGTIAYVQETTDTHVIWLPGEATKWGMIQLAEYLRIWYNQLSP